ncbi:MAG: 3'-5' exonuclease [Polyangiaceae bacterium]|nr:3'-5' exonuclease [Polyangiaceae bacterium]
MRGTSDVCGCFPTGRQYPGISHIANIAFVGAAREIEASKPWINHTIAMIDTETTGRDPNDDRIVEIAIVKGRDGAILSQDSWLINPEMPIPAEAAAVHGIHDDDVRGQPVFAEVCDEILECLANAIPAAYNAPFDRRFLLAEIARLGKSSHADVPAIRDRVIWIDPLVWARVLYPNEKSRKLTAMATLLNVTLEQAHRATADAEAALMVMYKMANDSRVPEGYGQMVQEQQNAERAQEDARRIWRRR